MFFLEAYELYIDVAKTHTEKKRLLIWEGSKHDSKSPTPPNLVRFSTLSEFSAILSHVKSTS
jgi:hypothetical protein